MARATVLAAVILSPWLFGSAQPWAYLLVSYLVGIGVGAWLLSLVCGERVRVLAPALTLSLVVLLGFVAFQMLPLPASFVEGVNPLAAEAQLTRRAMFQEIGVGEFLATGEPADHSLVTVSASAAATRTSFWLLAAYVGAFLVLANTLSDWPHVRRAAAAVVVSTFLMVVFALVQRSSGTSDLYWFHRPRFGGAIFGPFTNRNHFAAHISMGFGLTLGLLLLMLPKRAAAMPGGWRARLAWLTGRRAGHLLLLGFAVLLIGATVFATLSRGAIASLVVAVCAVAAVLALSRTAPGLGRVLAVVVVLVALGVRWLAWEPVVARINTLADVAATMPTNARTLATADTLRIFGASPLFGCGFGSFQHVFPIFQSEGIQTGRWLHAHNDYAQLLAEGGATGAVLAVAVALLFVWTVRSRLPRVPRRTKLFVGGLAVGAVAIACHSLVDYSLHRPANALFLAMLCALAVAATHVSSEATGSRLWSGLVRVGAVAGLAVLTVVFLRDPTELRGDLAFARFWRLQQLVERAESPAELADAVDAASAEADQVVRLADSNPDALCEVAAAGHWWARQPGIEPMARLRLIEQAVRAAALAARVAPSDYEPWLWLARAQASLGLERQAQLCTTRASYLAPPAIRSELQQAARARRAEGEPRVVGRQAKSNAGS